MKLRFSRLSRNDLVSIGEWISKDNPLRAAEYVFEIEGACSRLIEQTGVAKGPQAPREAVVCHVVGQIARLAERAGSSLLCALA